MFRSIVINKYLAKEFSKVIINIILIFFSFGIVMNVFEEINFFKDISIGIHIPIFLSSLLVPSLLYKMFPFIILLSGIWFFLKIKKSEEVTALMVSGMSNLSVMIVPCILAICIGIFFITAINPITSVLVKKYETIKGAYEEDKNYLAAITSNGIWIKEKGPEKNNIIRSEYLDGNNLINITIYEFDNENSFVRRIEAKSADISSLKWILKKVKIIDSNGAILSENLENLSFQSLYDSNKIKTLYKNLDTISFWNIDSQIKLLEERGYSTKDMETKLHKSLSFPLYLMAMVLLAGVFTLGMKFKENNSTYIFIAILSCVIVYFFNDFSAALGRTEKLSVQVAVWMPILIIFIFSSVGVIYANQK
jgi:lipopolysaccharide export system permease protein